MAITVTRCFLCGASVPAEAVSPTEIRFRPYCDDLCAQAFAWCVETTMVLCWRAGLTHSETIQMVAALHAGL